MQPAVSESVRKHAAAFMDHVKQNAVIDVYIWLHYFAMESVILQRLYILADAFSVSSLITYTALAVPRRYQTLPIDPLFMICQVKSIERAYISSITSMRSCLSATQS